MKHKQIACVLLLMMLFAMLCPCGAFAAGYVAANGHSTEMDIVVLDGCSYAPVRPLAKAMGLTVDYDANEGTVKLSMEKGAVNIRLQDSAYQASVNPAGTQYDVKTKGYVKMPVACVNRNGSTYVPVRFICNVFGAPVTMKGSTLYIGEFFTAEGKSADQLGPMTPAGEEDSVVLYLEAAIVLVLMMALAYQMCRFAGKLLKKPDSTRETPFDKNLNLATDTASANVRYLPDEKALFRGDAFYCRTERMVVGEEQHGIAMALPDSQFLYHPINLEVEYQYGNVIVFNRGTLVITGQRMLFMNGNEPFELYNEQVTGLDIYTDGFAFMAMGDYYYMRLTDMQKVARALHGVFGYHGVQDHYGVYLFPQEKDKKNIYWQDGDV